MAFIGNTVQTQGFTPQIDYFNGNGSTVTFTLSRPVVSVAQMIVSIDNVIQNPSSAYTVSGSSITFTSAPLSGTNNIWVEYTSLITTYASLSQSPSVIGDITASGGYLAVGNFGASFVDGTIVDYVTGNGRITAGPADGITLYNGGTSARTALAAWDASGNLTNTGSIGSPASTALTLKSAGTTAVTIDTSQNVGIQVSPYAWNSAYKATCFNNGYSIANLTSSGYTHQVSNAFYNSAGDWKYINTNGAGTYINSNGLFAWQIAPSGTAGTTASFTQVASILTNGAFIMGSATSENGQNSISFSNYSDTASYGKAMLFNTQYNSTRNAVVFQYNSSGVGTIVTGTSSTSYNTSSDYRLKENIVPMTGALATVSALKPVSYKWKLDGKDGQGFIAHELQEVVPEAVSGVKDAVETYTDEDGNEQTRIKPQGIDTSFLVATLTAAIQELNAKVTALEAKLEAK
jgi:hypothetical protein